LFQLLILAKIQIAGYIRFVGVNEMARKKASPIEEASRKELENGRYYNPWRSAKQKQDELFRKLRKEIVST
jgi:hypothetical protein